MHCKEIWFKDIHYIWIIIYLTNSLVKVDMKSPLDSINEKIKSVITKTSPFPYQTPSPAFTVLLATWPNSLVLQGLNPSSQCPNRCNRFISEADNGLPPSSFAPILYTNHCYGNLDWPTVWTWWQQEKTKHKRTVEGRKILLSTYYRKDLSKTLQNDINKKDMTCNTTKHNIVL